MKLFLGTSAVAVLAFGFATVSFAQEPQTRGATGGSTEPESIRIQKQTERQNSLQPTAPSPSRSNNPSTEAPGNPTSPVGTHRIDPAAPSPNRLQIDEGQSTRARENPDANAPQGGSGTSYNSIIRGAPSSSGTSSGDTGSGVSGSSTSPSGSSTSTGSSPGAGTSGSSGSTSGSSGGGSGGGGGN